VQRIYAGAVRFGWPEPYLVVLRQHMAARSIDLPMPTISAGGTHIGLAMPVLIRSDSHGAGQAARPLARGAGADDRRQRRHRHRRAVPDRPARRTARAVDRPAAARP
jgi:hypothetical protein